MAWTLVGTIRGPSAYEVAVEEGFVGTEAEWLESLKGPSNLRVGPANPNLTEPGLWVQTFPNGDLSLWVEDGT